MHPREFVFDKHGAFLPTGLRCFGALHPAFGFTDIGSAYEMYMTMVMENMKAVMENVEAKAKENMTKAVMYEMYRARWSDVASNDAFAARLKAENAKGAIRMEDRGASEVYRVII